MKRGRPNEPEVRLRYAYFVKCEEVIKDAKVEPALGGAVPESRWQFERMGYFCADRRESKPGALVFNRTVTLRDEWTKLVNAGRENK